MRIFTTKTSFILVLVFFVLNIFSLSGIFDEKKIAIGGNAIEQFFATVTQPADIISNMMAQKTQKKPPVNNQKTKENKNCLKVTEYVPTVTIILTMLLAGFVLYRIRILMEQFTMMVNYPIKIPWRTCIFLLMIKKILFNVLPRSADAYGYKYAVCKVCVA